MEEQWNEEEIKRPAPAPWPGLIEPGAWPAVIKWLIYSIILILLGIKIASIL